MTIPGKKAYGYVGAFICTDTSPPGKADNMQYFISKHEEMFAMFSGKWDGEEEAIATKSEAMQRAHAEAAKGTAKHNYKRAKRMGFAGALNG